VFHGKVIINEHGLLFYYSPLYKLNKMVFFTVKSFICIKMDGSADSQIQVQ